MSDDAFRIETVDLAEVTSELRRACGDRVEGEVVGRTVLRDAVAHHLRCSQLRAEMVVDTLIARGFIRPDETPGAPFAWVTTGA